MLPPKEMNTSCLSCFEPLAHDLRLCPACGADSEVELEVAMVLNPALKSLRIWLALAALLLLINVAISFDTFDNMTTLEWGLVGCAVVFFAGIFVAGRAPLVISGFAAASFAAFFAFQVYEMGAWVLFPGFGMVLRLMSAVILYHAVRGSLKARAIRQRVHTGLPKATARIR